MTDGEVRPCATSSKRTIEEEPLPMDPVVRCFNASFLVTPVALLSLLILVLAHSVALQEQTQWKSRRVAANPSPDANPRGSVNQPPTLRGLLADVVDALEDANVTHWLLPGLGLLPPSSASRDRSAEGRLNPWQEGIDIGVYQADLMRVILAQTTLQPSGIVPVESYYGLRLYSIYGAADDRYDFHTPFVDILYFKDESNHAINFCCDCAPITVSACTKKMCGCLVCATKHEELFPLSKIRIDGVRRAVSCPRNKEALFLPRDLPGVHPALFDM